MPPTYKPVKPWEANRWLPAQKKKRKRKSGKPLFAKGAQLIAAAEAKPEKALARIHKVFGSQTNPVQLQRAIRGITVPGELEAASGGSAKTWLALFFGLDLSSPVAGQLYRPLSVKEIAKASRFQSNRKTRQIEAAIRTLVPLVLGRLWTWRSSG